MCLDDDSCSAHVVTRSTGASVLLPARVPAWAPTQSYLGGTVTVAVATSIVASAHEKHICCGDDLVFLSAWQQLGQMQVRCGVSQLKAPCAIPQLHPIVEKYQRFLCPERLALGVKHTCPPTQLICICPLRPTAARAAAASAGQKPCSPYRQTGACAAEP